MGAFRSLSSLPSTVVFGVHAGLPGLGCFLSVRDILQPLTGDSEQGYLLILIGFCGLLANFGRWCDDQKNAEALLNANDKRRNDRDRDQFFGLVTVSRDQLAAYKEQALFARKVLYFTVIALFLLEEILLRFLSLVLFLILGEGYSNIRIQLISQKDSSLWNYATLYFFVSLLGAQAQEHLLSCVKKRRVLLHLLGARQSL